jgi:UDP-glucose 4-epimerase
MTSSTSRRSSAEGSKIDGDPMLVAQDLSIDAEMFLYVCRNKPRALPLPQQQRCVSDRPADREQHAQAEGKRHRLQEDGRAGHDLRLEQTHRRIPCEDRREPLRRACHVHPAVQRVRRRPGPLLPCAFTCARAANKENPFEVWGTGKQGRDFVHIDDVLDLTLLAMDKISDGRAINIGMGKLTSFLELIDVFTGFAGYKPTIKPLLDKPVGVTAAIAT